MVGCIEAFIILLLRMLVSLVKLIPVDVQSGLDQVAIHVQTFMLKLGKLILDQA